MQESVWAIDVQIEETDSGLFCATSVDLPGLLVAVSRLDDLGEALQEQIKMLVEAQTNKEVDVWPARRGSARSGLFGLWAAVPHAVHAA